MLTRKLTVADGSSGAPTFKRQNARQSVTKPGLGRITDGRCRVDLRTWGELIEQLMGMLPIRGHSVPFLLASQRRLEKQIRAYGESIADHTQCIPERALDRLSPPFRRATCSAPLHFTVQGVRFSPSHSHSDGVRFDEYLSLIVE